ncbi:MAG: hypothetical protein PHF67_00745 [Candidatus Nanoarchaeia archaeon]|nr:hypothetical protein [Candidatus Nanoarchaeia archaeon]
MGDDDDKNDGKPDYTGKSPTDPMDPRNLYGDNNPGEDYIPQQGPTRRPLTPEAKESSLEEEMWEVFPENLGLIKKLPR